MSENIPANSQYNETGTSAMTNSKRRKIFASQSSSIQNVSHFNLKNTSPSKDILAENNVAAEGQIFKVINKLNDRLEASKHIEFENGCLRQQNMKLKQLLGGIAQSNIMRKQRQQLLIKNQELKKRIERARLIVELLREQNYKKQLIELLQL